MEALGSAAEVDLVRHVVFAHGTHSVYRVAGDFRRRSRTSGYEPNFRQFRIKLEPEIHDRNVAIKLYEKVAHDFASDHALGRLVSAAAAEVYEGIVNEVRNHVREQRQPDDITLIAVRVL